ncbi:porin [Shewanella olleyana]|uniref:porin n=1 Tax=Shewanella olleyana TaxID=135626 RepID=UPI00200BF34E|nr:porin [Shewanella olleyana]MCL1065383.1 porin [Shewanella olleyana]
MKKTLIASALTTVMFVPAASAIEIYKDDKNSVEIGGFVDARVYHGQDTTEVVNGASRINFGFDRQMGDGWNAFAKLEWGVNPFGNSKIQYNNDQLSYDNDEFLANRLGYVGVNHDTYGTLTVGKQWGAWYDVVYNTNYGFVWDGDASGTYTFNKGDGSVNGTGRGDKTIQYRNAFGDFSFAVQAQLKQDEFEVFDDGSVGNEPSLPMINAQESIATIEYNNTYGLALTYQATDKFVVTAGFNTGEFSGETVDNEKIEETDLIYGIGLTYGAGWDAEGLYVAANYSKQEFHDTDNIGRLLSDAYGVETLLSYRFNNNIRAFASYNIIDGGDAYQADYNGDTFKRQFTAVGVHYIWDANTVIYIEGRIDSSDFSGSEEAAMKLSDDDGIGFGIRYTL